jgi:hypothetical protein
MIQPKTIGFVGLLLALAGVLGAAAEPTNGEVRAAKKVECNQQADAKEFGVHEYQRHRFVIRCVADLPDLDLYD